MLPLLALSGLLATPPAGAEWPTYRGNPARTGCVDDVPGPAAPKLAWVVKSQDQFVAAPVPAGPNVIAAGIGAFNRPTLVALPLAGSGEAKPAWQRSAPYLRLPSVSGPAVSRGLLVFGDGMHQDAGGVLHCLTAAAGQPVWQRPVPGELVHLEGSPTVSAGRVVTGAGSAGVICVELEQATLDGQPAALADIQDRQAKRWAELQADYERAKKKDPDLAVPPGEDQLLKFAPKPAWQVGANAWHVDAPVNVVGDKVLVCSSYLDKEKTGERMLYCLDLATGNTVWKQPLALNPWGGASVLGDTVVVTGSTVGYYLTQLKGAKGDVSAFDLKTGAPKWRKELPGGAIGCAALAGGVAVVTATDGKVRAFALNNGDRRWLHDVRGPVLAPAAISNGTVYIADLQGVVHAVALATGAAVWKFDAANDPAVKSPGMVYGGVTVHAGRLVLGTVNLEGPNARKPTFLACVGGK